MIASIVEKENKRSSNQREKNKGNIVKISVNKKREERQIGRDEDIQTDRMKEKKRNGKIIQNKIKSKNMERKYRWKLYRK